MTERETSFRHVRISMQLRFPEELPAAGAEVITDKQPHLRRNAASGSRFEAGPLGGPSCRPSQTIRNSFSHFHLFNVSIDRHENFEIHESSGQLISHVRALRRNPRTHDWR